MRKRRFARTLSVGAAVAMAVVGSTTAAHADSTVQWHHATDGKCLSIYLDWTLTTPEDVALNDCWAHRTTDFYDVANSDGTWLEKGDNFRGYCMAAYWDYDVYMEPCTGNDYQHWYEIYDSNAGGWRLKNKATGAFLDSNGSSVYMHDYNGGNYQLWH